MILSSQDHRRIAVFDFAPPLSRLSKLSPPQTGGRGLFVSRGGWGENKRKHAGDDGKGKRGILFHRPPRA